MSDLEEVALHEAAHAVVQQYVGGGVRGMELSADGGGRTETEGPADYRVALAGAVASYYYCDHVLGWSQQQIDRHLDVTCDVDMEMFIQATGRSPDADDWDEVTEFLGEVWEDVVVYAEALLASPNGVVGVVHCEFED